MSSFSTHTAPISNGLEFCYFDSGAPPGSDDYATVIILHGSAFTANTFSKVHAHAHERNIRTVAVKRRGYAPTSVYTDKELEDIAVGSRSFLDRIGLHIAEFIAYFIKQNKIPKATTKDSGGVVVLGWSMGCASALSLFSDTVQGTFSPGLYDELKSYIRQLILYDPPFLAFGWSIPPEFDLSIIYDPWDPNRKTPPEQQFQVFKAWVGSYYDHPENPTSINDLDHRMKTNHITFDAWTDDDWKDNYDEEAAIKTEFRMFHPPMQPTIKKMVESALYNPKAAFSHVPSVLLLAKQSAWATWWVAMETERRYKEAKSQGRVDRPQGFIMVAGANHFIHWDEPEKIMDAIKLSVEGKY